MDSSSRPKPRPRPSMPPPSHHHHHHRLLLRFLRLPFLLLLLVLVVHWPQGAEGFAAKPRPSSPPPPSSPSQPPLKQYYASCSQGLSDALELELLGDEVGALKVEQLKRGCRFLGTEATGYRALIHSRVANGVWQLMVRQRGIESRDDIYALTGRVDWGEAMGIDQTLGVQCVIGEGVPDDISHSHYSSLTVKNAVVDQFRDRCDGRRPSVDAETPDLPLVLFLQRDEAWLYRSLSGLGSLHKRGYRDAMHRSSLRETLAAAMLLYAGYDPERHVLLDPMCGSGTIAIEAALMARRIAPGLLRLRTGRDLAAALTPARWPDTDVALLKEVVRQAKEQQRDAAPLPIMANDFHPGAFQLACKDAAAAGVAESISFSNMDVEGFSPLHKPTLVVSNPPWDLRLSEGAAESWESMGRFLKREAGDSTAFLLSGNPDVTRGLRMKVERKIPIEQSGLSLRLLKYTVLPPRPRAPEASASASSEPTPARAPVVSDEPPAEAAPAAPAAAAAAAAAAPAAAAAEAAPAAKPKRGRPRKTPLPGDNSNGSAGPTTTPRASASGSVSRKAALSSAAATIMGAFVALGAPGARRPAAASAAVAAPAAAPAAAASHAATERLRRDYDGYSTGYDSLDGGPLAAWLGLDKARAELVGRARGRVLEAGVGTGLNLPFYRRVDSVDAIDLSPGMLREARAKAEGLGLLAGGGGFSVRFHERDVARLEGFADGSFDSVVDTFSLCVYPDPVAALRELARVVKPAAQGGRVLLLENARSKQPLLGAYQDATAQTLARDFGGKGCVWNQDVEALARDAGLRVVEARPIAGGVFSLLECERAG